MDNTRAIHHMTSSRKPGLRAWHLILQWLCLLCLAPLAQAAGDGNNLTGVEVGSLPGNRVRITLTTSQAAPKPSSFTIDNPARLALDLPGVHNGLKQKHQTLGVGIAKSLTAIEGRGRTRVVLKLTEMAPYQTQVEGHHIIITLQDPAALAAADTAPGTSGAGQSQAATTVTAGVRGAAGITDIDFRRGPHGEGRVIVTLAHPSTAVDLRQEGGRILADFLGATLPKKLRRRLDVTDFATPVRTIDAMAHGKGSRLVITPGGEYDYVAYQTGNRYTIEIKPMSKAEKAQRRKDKLGFTGKRLSLNFQDIEVRSVLQLIADFTGKNIVVSDTVKGNLSLRLQNVPWDQALDIILKTKGLAMRKTGNVMLVAPSDELAAREKLELQSQKQIEELAPLHSEFIQINYAKAADMAKLIRGAQGSPSLLSDRGSATVDRRTNTLLVQDTADRLDAIRRLIAKLDVPVRQVLIESRIVIANDDFARDLGAKLGVGKRVSNNAGTTRALVGGGLPGDIAQSGDFGSFINNPPAADPPTEALLVDLPVANPALAANLIIGAANRQFLRLEIEAMQAEGRGEVVSNPRVVTSDQQAALIRQGVEIPYLEASSSGAATVSFKEAVLALRVTPHITPDDRISMDLEVSKDSVGQVFEKVPSINTRAVKTQVLVDNGDTVVLGGIYERTHRNEVDKVPLLGDIPILGHAFRTTRKVNNKSELLIFVTPKIIKQALAAQ